MKHSVAVLIGVKDMEDPDGGLHVAAILLSKKMAPAGSGPPANSSAPLQHVAARREVADLRRFLILGCTGISPIGHIFGYGARVVRSWDG